MKSGPDVWRFAWRKRVGGEGGVKQETVKR